MSQKKDTTAWKMTRNRRYEALVHELDRKPDAVQSFHVLRSLSWILARQYAGECPPPATREKMIEIITGTSHRLV